MVTPYEKLLSGGNDTIQIVVTTACDLYTCSNCTQLLPFRKDYRHMSVKCFEQALKYLKDWPGVVGMFGGNPCCHPEFEVLCDLMDRYIQPQSRRGLWSNNILGHGPMIRKVFYPDGRFNLNVHRNIPAAMEIMDWLPDKLIKSSVRSDSWHSPILLNYKDLGMSEAEWVTAREACDINRKWSAAVVERSGRPYAYFCEVAAALDGIKGENHGMPLHHEWWKSPMVAYAHQVHACCDQGCGVPLRHKGHEDTDAVYDITHTFVPYTQLAKKIVTVAAATNRDTEVSEVTDYLRLRS